MTSEEILSVLEELANNVGDCLYDWDVKEIDQLYELVSKLKETAREVREDLHAEEYQAP